MSGFLWDMLGDHDSSMVRPKSDDEAEASSSSGYSPSSSQGLRENPSRVVPCDPPRQSVPLGSAHLEGAATKPSAENPSSVPIAQTNDLSPRDICSSMRARDVVKICKALNIGPEFRARLARSDERMCTFHEGEIAVFVHNIRMGLRLPFNSFFRSLFLEYGLMPCQFTPNAYRCAVGFS